MKNCATIRELLFAVLDGEARPEERAAVEAHLAACADCREEREELARARQVLGGLVAEGALGASFARDTAQATRRRPKFPASARLATAAALLLALATVAPKFAVPPPLPAVRNAPPEVATHVEVHTPVAPVNEAPPETVTQVEVHTPVAPVNEAPPETAIHETEPTPTETATPAAAAPRLETRVFTQGEFLAGSRAGIRVLTLDWKDQHPLAGAAVSIRLVPTSAIEGSRPSPASVDALLCEGITDTRGTLPASFFLPELPEGDYAFEVRSVAGVRKNCVRCPIRLRSGTAMQVTADKPSYQPGQVMHLRVLALRRANLIPLGELPVTIEVEDPDGNKLFKERKTTSRFGIADASFALANEIKLGAYRLRATLERGAESIKVEQPVLVDRYVLPKFKLTAKLDRERYRPGETMALSVQADYFFGKPVADAQLEIVGRMAGEEKAEIFRMSARTGADGACNLTGLNAAGRQGRLEILVKATDPGKQCEQAALATVVTDGAIRLAAFAEGGKLTRGLAGAVWVLAHYADGSPAEAQLTVEMPDGGRREIASDALGLARLGVTPGEGLRDGCLVLGLCARDARGNAGKFRASVPCETVVGGLTVKLDRATYRAGAAIQVSVQSLAPEGPIFIDVRRQGQTVLTCSFDLLDGEAEGRIELPSDCSGVVEVCAYRIVGGLRTAMDARRALVDPAQELTVELTPDRESYRPGAPAELEVRVKDAQGNPVAAALGLRVVDPSVLARTGEDPGLDRLFFLLEGEALETFQAIPGVDGRRAWLEEDDTKRERAAAALLAATQGAERLPLRISSRVQDVLDEVRADAEALAGAAWKHFAQERERLHEMEIVAAWQELDRAGREGRLQPDRARLDAAHDRIWAAIQKYWKQGKSPLRPEMQGLLREALLLTNDLMDPWGHPYRCETAFCSCGPEAYPHELRLQSAGPDGQWYTADDVTVLPGTPKHMQGTLPVDVNALAAAGALPEGMTRDPWGTEYRIDVSADMKIPVTLRSAGPDGRHGTEDDLVCAGKMIEGAAFAQVKIETLLQERLCDEAAAVDPFEEPYELKLISGKSGPALMVRSLGRDRVSENRDDLVAVVTTEGGNGMKVDLTVLESPDMPGILDSILRPEETRLEAEHEDLRRRCLGFALNDDRSGESSWPDDDESFLSFYGQWSPGSSVPSIGVGCDHYLTPEDDRSLAAQLVDLDWISYQDSDATILRDNGDYGDLGVEWDVKMTWDYDFSSGFGWLFTDDLSKFWDDRSVQLTLARQDDFHMSTTVDWGRLSHVPGRSGLEGSGLLRDQNREAGGLKFTYNLDDKLFVDLFYDQVTHSHEHLIGMNIDGNIDEKALLNFIYAGIYNDERIAEHRGRQEPAVGIASTDGYGVNNDMSLFTISTKIHDGFFDDHADSSQAKETATGAIRRESTHTGAAPASRPARLRSYFPETLFVAPQVITGDDGKAHVTIPLADTITRWEALAFANSLDGRLGTAHRSIQVFQDFFLDVGLPAYVTQNDTLTVPVSVMNYGKEPQEVKIALAPASWYETLGPGEASLHIEAGKVSGAEFRIRAKAVGRHRLRVDASTPQDADAMARDLDVIPDGREQVFFASERLAAGRRAYRFAVSPDAIDGAGGLVVRLLPTAFTQVLDGLDAILEMPSG